jgi:hypothetical protein
MAYIVGRMVWRYTGRIYQKEGAGGREAGGRGVRGGGRGK